MFTTNTASLLDRVLLQDFDDSSEQDTCDLEVADINHDTKKKCKKPPKTSHTVTNEIPVVTKKKVHNRNNHKKDGYYVRSGSETWTPESYDQDRSKSPVMSAFKKVKDWMNAPTQSPVPPITPIETPDIDLQLHKLMQKRLKRQASESHNDVTKQPRRHRRHRRRGQKNTGYDETEA